MSPLAAQPQFDEFTEDGKLVNTDGMTPEQVERREAVSAAWQLRNKHDDDSKLFELGLA